jgi:YVTN family beta-propeller protein
MLATMLRPLNAQYLERSIPLNETIAGGATTWPGGLAFNATEDELYAYGRLGWVAVLDCASNRIVREIPVSQSWYYSSPLWVAQNNKVYFQSTNGLVIVNGASDSVEVTLPLSATSIAFDDTNNCLVVANQESLGVLLLIDGTTNAVRSRLSVNGFPLDVVWSPENRRYYVEYEGRISGNYWLEVIEAGTGVPIDSLRLPASSAYALAYAPQSNRLYAGYESLLVVIDAGADSVLANLPVGAWELLWNSFTNRLYCMGESTVVIDCATDSVFSRLHTGRNTFHVVGVHRALDSRSGRLAIEDSTGVTLIDGTADTVVSLLRFNSYQENDMAVDPSGGRMFIATEWPDMVRTIDTRNDCLSESAYTSTEISDIVFNPLVGKLYVRALEYSNLSPVLPGTVNVIDAATGTVLKQLRTGADDVNLENYENMCLDPTDTKLYCPNVSDDDISVIDCQSDQVIRVIPAPPRPSWLAVNPRDHKLYCIHDADDAGLTVIDCNADTVITTIPFPGSFPLYAVWHAGVAKLYVLDGAGVLHVVDGRTNQVIKTLPPMKSGYLCPPVCDLQDDRLYVATDGAVIPPALYSIDVRADSIIDSTPQLWNGSGLTWNASSDKACFWAMSFPDSVGGIGMAVLRCSGDTFLGFAAGGEVMLNGVVPVSNPEAPRVYFAWGGSSWPSGDDTSGIGVMDCNEDSVVALVRLPVENYQAFLYSGLALDSLNSRVFAAGQTHVYFARDEPPGICENRAPGNRPGLWLTCSFERGGTAVLIRVSSAEPVMAALTLCDITGRTVRSFASRRVGQHGEWRWNLRNNRGQMIPSGVYFCRLTAKFIGDAQLGSESRTWKLVIAR